MPDCKGTPHTPPDGLPFSQPILDGRIQGMYPADMDIEFDPRKAAFNLRKHGVSFAHAEAALRDPEAITIEDPDAEGEQRFVTLGRDALGRLLVVVHTPRHGRTHLISARKASPKEGQHHA